MKRQKRNGLLSVLWLISLLLAACGPSAEQQATANSLEITRIVETLMVGLTETALAEPTLPATATSVPTLEQLPTQTPTIEIATFTPFPTQPAAQQGPAISSCDLASFVEDLSIPDGTELAPGQAFTKSWRIKNEGTCTWSADYQLLYFGGEIMSAEVAYKLTDHEVAPGETLDISIPMTAPASAGTYNMYWIMRNTNGENFGVDASGGAIYVQIVVSSTAQAYTATPTVQTPTKTPTDTPVPSDTPVQ